MNIPFEVLVYLFKYVSKSDRLALSETCRLWYLAANDTCFIRSKYVTFYKTSLNVQNSPIPIFEESELDYCNYIFSDVEITNDIDHFWDRIGANVRSLTLRNCDICEKVFISILQKCPNLETLNIENCRELFMSGCLLDGTKELFKENLEKLKMLSLSKNQYVSDALFERFTMSTPHLKELNLATCPIQFHLGLVKRFYPYGLRTNASESILTFFFVLEFLKNSADYVKHLSFSNTLIDGSALKSISEIEDLKLETLHLHGCDQLTNTGILALTNHQTTLKELDVSLCTRVTDQSLVQICNNLVNLEYLNIQRCRAVTDLGASEICKLKKLTSLNISQCELITTAGLEKAICFGQNKTLMQLNISSLNLNIGAIMMISERLPNLRFLDMNYCFNGVTDKSIQLIFKNQVLLHTLKISHCDKVSDAGLTGMDKVEVKSRDDFPSTSEQEYSHPKIHLGSKAEEEIIRDAKRKYEVMKLCEDITSDSFTGYSLSCLPSLKELNLSSCNKITDVSMIYSFHLKELVTLNLSSCQQITHEGMELLVKNCPSIEYFKLIDCYNLKDEAVLIIVKGLKRLKHLQLRGCNQLTDKSLEAVKMYCNKLQFLDVQGCRNMTPELANSISNLPTLHTLLISKPGPYLNDGLKNREPAPTFLPSLMRKLKLT